MPQRHSIPSAKEEEENVYNEEQAAVLFPRFLDARVYYHL